MMKLRPGPTGFASPPKPPTAPLPRWTLPQDQNALSSTGQKLLTTHVFGGITDGANSGGGTEYADATAMNLIFQVVFVLSITGSL